MDFRGKCLLLKIGSFFLLLSFIVFLPSADDANGQITYQQRIDAQRAIEKVYYDQRAAYTKRTSPQTEIKPFEEKITDEILKKKVDKYMAYSGLLEHVWKRPVTAAQLQRELDRMALGTKNPDVLNALFEALNNDPKLIAETLARQNLVSRLAHNWYSFDATIHKKEKEKTDKIWDLAANMPNWESVKEDGVQYIKSVYTSKKTDKENIRQAENNTAIELDPDTFIRRYEEILNAEEKGLFRETEGGFIIERLSYAEIQSAPDLMNVESLYIAKIPFDEWFQMIIKNMKILGTEEKSLYTYILPVVTGELTPMEGCTEEWTKIGYPASPRARHSTVWTGTEMIVWGGKNDSFNYCNTGGRYDTATDCWTLMTSTDAPAGRYLHTAVWTGTEMIVWGGYDGSLYLNTGGRYDPDTDTWTATSLTGVPAARGYHTAVWTGTEMVVWGGANPVTNTGGRYDPTTDSWTATSVTGAPSARTRHTAVWTETEMIVWGGNDGSYTNTGGRYDPTSDSWTTTSLTGAPIARDRHTAVWTGTEMIVWGGNSYLNTGGRYDPDTDSWAMTSLTDAPSGRIYHTAVWTGSEMVIWGGFVNISPNHLNTGGRYNPATDSWTATSLTGEPSGRYYHTAVWTEAEMIVWGGQIDSDLYLNSGARYNPETDSWITMVVPPLSNLAAVWTGAELIIWGKDTDYGIEPNHGVKYNLATDSWTVLSTTNAPSSRLSCSAIWTGTEMIIWGGYDPDSYIALNSGGRYDSVADSWIATSLVDAPSGGSGYTAIWTGSDMIVWGGGTEGKYNSILDIWSAISKVDAPSERVNHSAVWTGTEMIIWGGEDGPSSVVNTGARYNPVSDTWATMSTLNCPQERTLYAAVWTGTEMIVWGGVEFPSITLFDSGGRYNPLTDIWTATSLLDAPLARMGHSAVWTGTEMIVWGGSDPYIDCYNTGGIYNPLEDTWKATSMVNVPTAREMHLAVWTGSEMFIWGGSGEHDHGGIYSYGLASVPLKQSPLNSSLYPPGTDSATISWNSVTDAESYDYEVSDSNCGGAIIASGNITGTSQFMTGLTDGGTYYWRVRSNNSCGTSSWSDCWSFSVDIDTDSDGVGDSEDCAPYDSDNWSIPSEALALMIASDKSTFTWTAPFEPGCTTPVYDVLRSTTPSDFSAAVCIESDDTDLTANDPAVPVSGYYYFVRVENSCGDNMGADSDSVERTGADCP